jgi:tripartite-type tricarboxylate transporter receptor subunit TctC
MVGWFAVVAPTGTPAAAVLRMNKEINAVLSETEVMQRMLTIGPLAEAMGAPDQLGAFLNREFERWNGVAKEIGLLPE